MDMTIGMQMDMTIGMVSMKVSNLSPNRRNMAGCWVEEQITGSSPNPNPKSEK